MRGDLSEKPAADVCRALAIAGATGVLDIEGPEGRGSVVCSGGDVIAATSPTPHARLGDRLVNAGLLDEAALDEVLRNQARAGTHRQLGAMLVEQGLVTQDAIRLVAQEQVIDAVFDVMRWRYGGYHFAPSEAFESSEVPLRLPVDQLLVEVSRRQQEWEELERVIPDLAAVPNFRAGTSSAAASLEPDEFTLLASIDGVRSVRQLADDLGYGQFEAARIVYGLALLGIVEVDLPEDEVGRALEEALHALEVADPLDPSETDGGPGPAPWDDDHPRSEPAPWPDPQPWPDPDAEPDPEPEPWPGPDPEPDPEPEPWPGPDPEPWPDPGPSPEPDPAPDPRPEPQPGPWMTRDDEPPGLIDVARLLAELETEPSPPHQEAVAPPTTATPDALADGAAVADDAPDRHGTVDDDRMDKHEVSELLRELSRLALDDTDDADDADPEPRRDRPPGAPRRDRPARDVPGRDDPPRRRRLFGRG